MKAPVSAQPFKTKMMEFICIQISLAPSFHLKTNPHKRLLNQTKLDFRSAACHSLQNAVLFFFSPILVIMGWSIPVCKRSPQPLSMTSIPDFVQRRGKLFSCTKSVYFISWIKTIFTESFTIMGILTLNSLMINRRSSTELGNFQD